MKKRTELLWRLHHGGVASILLSILVGLSGCGQEDGAGEIGKDVVVLIRKSKKETAGRLVQKLVDNADSANEALSNWLVNEGVELGFDRENGRFVWSGSFEGTKKIADYESVKIYVLLDAITDYLRSVAEEKKENIKDEKTIVANDNGSVDEIASLAMGVSARFGKFRFKTLRSCENSMKQHNDHPTESSIVLKDTIELCYCGQVIASVSTVFDEGKESDDDSIRISHESRCEDIVQKLRANGLKLSCIAEAVATLGGVEPRGKKLIVDGITQGQDDGLVDKMFDSGLEGYSYSAVYVFDADSHYEFLTNGK